MNEGTDKIKEMPLSKDVIFQILSNRRRRYALHYLRRKEESAEIGELATQIAAWENDVIIDEVTSQQRKRVYNTLQQAHLPKLNETGFIDYDPAHGDITLTERAEPLNTYLEIVPDNNLPWSEYYFVLGCISLALLTGAQLGAGPLGLVPEMWLTLGLALLITISGAVHMYYHRNHRLGHTEVPEDE